MKRAVASVVMASAFSLPAPVFAEQVSKFEYQVTRKNIESDFRGPRSGCEPMPDKVQERGLAADQARATARAEPAGAPARPSAR